MLLLRDPASVLAGVCPQRLSGSVICSRQIHHEIKTVILSSFLVDRVSQLQLRASVLGDASIKVGQGPLLQVGAEV